MIIVLVVAAADILDGDPDGVTISAVIDHNDFDGH
jgi:hypothetical protein